MKMKFIAAGAAFCALGMTGCSNETDETSVQTGKQVVMTMQTAADGPQTRADYTENGDIMEFSWRKDDAIRVVVDGTTNNNCKLTTTEAGKSAPFTGTVTEWTGTKNIYAIYPYSSTSYTVSGGETPATATTTLALPNPQLYTVGGAISNSLMVGTGTATANGTAINASASLKQVMSIIKLNITNAPGKVKGVKLTCAETLFPTTATVKLSDATITNPGGLTKVLSMTVTDDTEGTDKAISFAMFPTTGLNGKDITVEVTLNDGTTKSVTKKGVDFARNMHYVMDFDGTPEVSGGIVIGKLEWATGNLVAKGANGCKIGAPTDGGLYFQFGSLIGWAGGANGNGTGVPKSNSPGYTYKGAGTVVPSGTTVPTTYDDPVRWTAGTTEAETVPAENDPCTYYLGSSWRLPTKTEYVMLFGFQNAWTSDWSWNDTSKSAIHTSGLTFPASGDRNDSGGLSNVGSSGRYWSASPYSNITRGYLLNFFKNLPNASNSYDLRKRGMPVRCVRNKVTK